MRSIVVDGRRGIPPKIAIYRRALLKAPRSYNITNMQSKRTRRLWLLASVAVLTYAAYGQIADSAADVVAGIPVNYTEANSGVYTLPDPLKLNSGQPVRDARMWSERRRPEIRKLIEDTWFGRSPGRPKDMTFEVVEEGTPVFDGTAIRRQITIHFTKERTSPKMELLMYLPAHAKGPAPMFLNMSFSANNLAVADPQVKIGRRWDRESSTQVPADAPPPRAGAAAGAVANRGTRGLRVEQFIAEGIGIATFNKDDLAPDFVGQRGVRYQVGLFETGPDQAGR